MISTVLGLSIPAWAVDLTPDLQLHGFFTAGLAKLSGSQGQTYPTNPGGTGTSIIESDVTSKYDSVAGIQLNYRLSDHVDMVLQTYLAAQDLSQHSKLNQYALKVNSAYVDYNFNDNWTIRGGRIPLADYLYSDNLRVGEAYPWVRLPPEIYAKLGGFFAENGLAVIYKHTFHDDWILRIQPFIGQENLNSFQVNQIKQLTASLSNDNLTLHLGSGMAFVNLDRPLVASLNNNIDQVLMGFGYSASDISQYDATFATMQTRRLRGTFSDVGLIYDDGRWFVAGEMSALRFSGFVNDFNAGYASVGYHLGKWLPYIVYAHYKDLNLDEINQIPAPGNIIYGKVADVTQDSMSVGVRYKIKNNSSFKLQ
ncbi:MAG: hypothetical protein KGO49_13245, partial [Gammaproteobacteria bacterium]|nr:hypothetical protein [Gammaproteobacteria bacterium]